MVLTIELEKALGQMATNMQPTKMWSPYRDPLTKYLNKYSGEVYLQHRMVLLDNQALWLPAHC